MDFLFCISQYENELINSIDVDVVHPYIESALCKHEDINKIYRLISIQSFTSPNGLKAKVWDAYKHEIVQGYGYDQLLVLHAMEQSDLVQLAANAFPSRSYSSIKNRLKLTWTVGDEGTRPGSNGNQSSSPQNRPDLAHVHHGYTPLSVRMVQHVEQFGFRSLADLLHRHYLPADVPLFDEVQQLPLALRKRRNSGGDASSLHSTSGSLTGKERLTMVFFLGGVTRAEVSALRLLSLKEGVNSDFLVATTSMLNGKSLVDGLVDMAKS